MGAARPLMSRCLDITNRINDYVKDLQTQTQEEATGKKLEALLTTIKDLRTNLAYAIQVDVDEELKQSEEDANS